MLFDADKLDAIGAVGVARAFLFAGEVGARLHNPEVRIEETQPYTADDTGYREYRVKLCRIRDRMLTATGRQSGRSSPPVHGKITFNVFFRNTTERIKDHEHQCG